MEDPKIKIGITQGDMNGVSYEVIIKTLSEAHILEFCTPVIYGSSKAVAFHRKTLEATAFNLNVISNISELNAKRVNIINCVDEEVKVELSQSTAAAGEAAFHSLQRATQDLKAGLIDALVTAPLNRENMQSKTVRFIGHSDYLETELGQPGKSLTLLTNDVMRVAIATPPMPLSKVSGAITKDSILEKLRSLKQCLVQDFSISLPRIAVLSLNPKTAENVEEQNSILPALKEAEAEGIVCVGVYEADKFFGSGSFEKFDAVLAMYWEQGQIPFKSFSREMGIRYTAGLSVIRTAPAHGVEYEKAGRNLTSEESFRQAMYLAYDVYRNRKIYTEISANPLKKSK